MSSRKSPARQVQSDFTDPEATAKNAFSSPTSLASRIKVNRQFPKSDQRDDGVSVASSRRDPDRFTDADSASVMSAISGSTSVRLPAKASDASKEKTTTKASKVSKGNVRTPTLRNLADVAGLSLHDAPPQVPVDSLQHQTKTMSLTDAAVANTKTLASAEQYVARDGTSNAGSATGSDVDPDLVSAIAKLVASTQAAAASGGSTIVPPSDIASLTRQIGQMAEQRRTSRTVASPDPSHKQNRESPGRRPTPPRPTPENFAYSPQQSSGHVTQNLVDKPSDPPPSQGRPQLDLMHNDNAFHVIADLVLQPFKRGANLSPEARAQLDSTVPQQMRESFVEAVRYRLQHNCPPGSSQHIHAVTRKCQVLGFDKERSTNPLLAAAVTIPSGATQRVNIIKQQLTVFHL